MDKVNIKNLHPAVSAFLSVTEEKTYKHPAVSAYAAAMSEQAPKKDDRRLDTHRAADIRMGRVGSVADAKSSVAYLIGELSKDGTLAAMHGKYQSNLPEYKAAIIALMRERMAEYVGHGTSEEFLTTFISRVNSMPSSAALYNYLYNSYLAADGYGLEQNGINKTSRDRRFAGRKRRY